MTTYSQNPNAAHYKIAQYLVSRAHTTYGLDPAEYNSETDVTGLTFTPDEVRQIGGLKKSTDLSTVMIPLRSYLTVEGKGTKSVYRFENIESVKALIQDFNSWRSQIERDARRKESG